MKIATALLLTISALSMWVCAAGNFRHTYALDPVQQVRLDAYGSIELSAGDDNRLDVIAGEDITPHLELKVVDDVLVITDTRTHSTWYKTKQWWHQTIGGATNDQDIHYRLTLKRPQALTLNGHFAAKVANLKDDTFTITFNGLGKLRVAKLSHEQLDITVNGTIDLETKNVRSRSLSVRANGTGSLAAEGLAVEALRGELKGMISCELSGRATSLKWAMDGSGDCTATSLQTDNAQLHIAGNTQMTVKVKRNLEAKTAGQGQINYYGQPKTKTQGKRINSIAGGYQARIYY